MKKLLTILCLIIMLAPSAYALTAALGNARAVLDVQASPEEPAIIERSLILVNKNNISVKVTLEPEDGFRRYIDIIDEEVIIEPNERAEADFILTIDHGGRIEGRINVLFEPADPEVKDNKVGLAATIVIISEGPELEVEETEEDPGQEEAAGVEEGTEETAEETVEELTEGTIEEAEEKSEPTPAAKKSSSKPKPISDGPNPLVGIGVMAAIVAVGFGLFAAIKKFMQ